MSSKRRTCGNGGWREHGVWLRMCHGLVVGCVLQLVAGRMLEAQVAYNVFPAATAEANVQAAQPTKRQAATVTLAVRDSSLAYVVRTLVHQAHLKIGYDNANPLFAKRITVRIAKLPVMDALASALKGTGLMATLAPDGETVVIGAPVPVDSVKERPKAASGVISGMVVDSATGQGMTGATIIVQGQQRSAMTSDRGSFVLTGVSGGEHTLVVKMLGYRTEMRTVTIDSNVTGHVRVVLVGIPTVLSGVVTTVAGKEQRITVGNDFTVLNVDSIQSIAPVSTVTDLLATRVPGLIVMPTSGVPGAPSRLRLRGTSGITTSNDPIVIVDGIRIDADQSGSNVNASLGGSVVVLGGGSSSNGQGKAVGAYNYAGPSPLDQIDPNSIETIEVMKGPSASALYGSDAANGVIIITTKQGRAGPTHWTLSLNAGFTTLAGDWPVNYFRFGHPRTYSLPGSVLCAPYDVTCATDSVVAFQALNDKRLSPLQTGTNQGASLSVSGGSHTMTYAVTGTASNQIGYLKLPAMEAERFAIDHGFVAPGWMKQPSSYITYGMTTRFNLQLGQEGRSIALTNSLYRSAQQQSNLPSALQQLSGIYIDVGGGSSPPQYYKYANRAQLKTTTSNTALTLQWPVQPWLPVQVIAGLSSAGNDNNQVTPRDYILGSPDSVGFFQMDNRATTAWTLNAGTTIPLPYMRVAIGLNVHTNSSTQYTANTSGLSVGVLRPNYLSYQNGTGPSYFAASTSTYGWYVQPRLNFGSRLFISPGFRIDGGSASGVNSTGFPKMDVSYLAIDRQAGDPLWGIITQLRPRIAFGTAGVQPGPAEKLRLATNGLVSPIGGTASYNALFISAAGNTQLRPERSRELEGGFDANLWEQRLSLTVSGYRKTRSDAIIVFPLAPSIGTTGNIAANVGMVRNTGLDASITARLIDAPALGWNVVANMSRNHNTVLSLVDGLDQIVVGESTIGSKTLSSVVIRPGFPLNAIFTRAIAGYADANGDGRIGPDEVRFADSAVYTGASTPDYELDLSTTLSFLNGRIRFASAASYQSGLTQNNRSQANSGSGPIDPTWQSNPYLLPLNDPSIPWARQAELAAFAVGGSDIGMYQTVNLLRWTSLSISYVLPSEIARWFRASSASVAVQGSNLGLHTNYRGKDPAVNSYATGNQVRDNGQLPTPRLWQLRVTLGQ